MLENDPVTIVLDLLSTEWDQDNTPLGHDPTFHTGWYDYDSSDQQVTITNADEGTIGGGDTGLSGGTGAGSGAQVRAGFALVNCWAGTRDDCKGVGPSGEDVNPKEVAYKMAREAHRILLDNADGTTTDAGEQELLSLSGDEARALVDTEPENAVYRYELTARFTYVVTA